MEDDDEPIPILEANVMMDYYLTHPRLDISHASHVPRAEVFPPRLATRLYERRFLMCEWDIPELGFNQIMHLPYTFAMAKDTFAMGSYIIGRSEQFRIPMNDIEDLTEWLDLYAGARFLITTPILRNETHTMVWAPCIHHTAKYTRFQPDTPPVSLEALNHLLEHRCYTVGNGLIYALALVRSGVISLDTFREAFDQCQIVNTSIVPYTLLYELDEFWTAAYNNHPTIPHLAEAAGYYALRANYAIADYLIMKGDLHMDDDDPFLVQTLAAGSAYATHKLHTMCPFAKPVDFEVFLPLFQRERILLADYLQYTENIVSSRATWDWFVHHGGANRLFSHIRSETDSNTAVSWLTACFCLFRNGSSRTSVRRSRIVRFWKMAVEYYCKTPHVLHQSLIQLLVRGVFNGPHTHPPILFMKWVYHNYGNRMDATRKTGVVVHRVRSMTYDPPHPFVWAGFSNHGMRMYTANISLNGVFALYENAESDIKYFIRWYNDMKATRLLVIQQTFGLGKYETDDTTGDQYRVGMAVMNYLQDHPACIGQFLPDARV